MLKNSDYLIYKKLFLHKLVIVMMKVQNIKDINNINYRLIYDNISKIELIYIDGYKQFILTDIKNIFEENNLKIQSKNDLRKVCSYTNTFKYKTVFMDFTIEFVNALNEINLKKIICK